MTSTTTLPLPIHFSVRVSPTTVLPVSIYDNHHCSFNENNKRRKQASSSASSNSQPSSTSFTQWFTQAHLDEIYNILPPFLHQTFSQSNSGVNQSKQKKSSASPATSPLSNHSFDLRKVNLSTERNLQIVRGNILQFTYQFTNTPLKQWLIVPHKNKKPRRKPCAEDAIIIDDDNEENDSVDPSSLEHNLDILSDDEEDVTIKDDKEIIISQEMTSDEDDDLIDVTEQQPTITSAQENNSPEENYCSYGTWIYSLMLHVEPYSSSDSQDSNPELISYYLKK